MTTSGELAIDVHAHAVPATVLELIARDGRLFGGIEIDRGNGRRPVITFPDAKPLRPLPRGMEWGEAAQPWLREQGIGAQLLAPWMDIQGNDLPAEHGRAWARALNDAMAEGMTSLSSNAGLLATVYPADPLAAVAEMQRARRDLGAYGVMLATHFAGRSAADATMMMFWEAAAAESVPVVLHPPIVGPASAIPGHTEFRSLYGRPLETSFVATRLLVDGVLSALPNLRIVLVHGGGYLPFQAGRIDQQVQSGNVTSKLGDRLPSEDLPKFYFDTAMLAANAVRFLTEFAPGHVMVGTDGPFTQGSVNVPAWLQTLPAEERERVAKTTAEQLFGPRLPEVSHAD